MPRPADPCGDYTRAVLARTWVLIERNEADRAPTAALIAELRAWIATSWEMPREIQQRTAADGANLHYRGRPRADPPTADAERDGA
jgi:hypothetical protein